MKGSLSVCVLCKDPSEHTAQQPPHFPPSKDSSKACGVSVVYPSLNRTTQPSQPHHLLITLSVHSPLHTIHHTHSNTHISFLMEQPKHLIINPIFYTFLIKLRKSPHTQYPPIHSIPKPKILIQPHSTRSTHTHKTQHMKYMFPMVHNIHTP